MANIDPRILAELTRLGAATADLVASADGAEHPNLRAFLASKIGIEEKVDAFADPASPCRGIFAVADGMKAREGERSFLEIARYEDAEKVIGVLDSTADDPLVLVTDLDDALDESSGRAKIPSRARQLGSLSRLLASMQRRPRAADGLRFERMELAELEFFRRGGHALLAGVITRDGKRGLGIYESDGRWVRLPFESTIEATAWAGEHVVVLTAGEEGRWLRIVERTASDAWSTRLEASVNLGGEPRSIQMVATRDSVIVWCQIERNPLLHVHAFAYDGRSLSEVGRASLCVEGMFADSNRIWCFHRGPDPDAPVAEVSELKIDRSGLRVEPGEAIEADPVLGMVLPVRAVDQGRVIRGNAYLGTFVVSVAGREIQRLSVPAGHGGGDYVEAEDGALLVRAESVRGFVFDGNAYVPWFETEAKDRLERVARVRDVLYANIRDELHRVVGHRVLLPPRPR